MDASIVVRLIDETRTGFNDIQRNLASVDSSSKTLTRTMDGLKTAAAEFVAALASGKIIDFIDSVQTMDNKLKLVEKSQGDVNIRFNELFDVAQRTRAPIAETVDLYSKLAQNQSVVGKTGAEITKVVEAFNLSLAISGTTGNAASGAITQFAQAMQSGKLQGDEFRSIAEAVPKVLQVLSDKTGIAREELKELASKGFLNAKIVAQALSEGLDDLQKEMDRTNKTVRGAITNMTNEFTKLGRSFLDSSGTSDALVKAIDHITENAEDLIPIIKLLGVGLAALAVVFATPTAAVIAVTVVVVKFAKEIAPIARLILDTFGKAIDYVVPKIGSMGAALKALINFKDPFEAYQKSMKEYQIEADASKAKTDALSKSTQDLTTDQKNGAGPSDKMNQLMKENGLTKALAGIETMKFNEKLKEQILLAGLDSEAKQRQALVNEGLSAKAKDLKKSVEDLTDAQKKDVIMTVDSAMVKISKANEELENRKRVFKESVDLLSRFADESRKQQNTTLTETGKFNKDLTDINKAYEAALINSKGKTTAEMKQIETDYQAAMKGIHQRGLNDLFNDYKKYTETTQTKAEQFTSERAKIEEAYRIAQLDKNNQTFAEQTAVYEKYQTAIQGLQAKYGADFKKAAEDFRNTELTGSQKYLKAVEELNYAYYEQGIISNKDYNDLLKKANKDFVDTTVKDYGNLYGLLQEKVLQWSGLSQKEYGIVKDTFKLVFGVDVETMLKQFFAGAIQYVLGFRTSATGDLNGIGGVLNGVFGKGGSGEGNVTGFASMAGTVFTAMKGGAEYIFSGIGSFISTIFSGGGSLFSTVSGWTSGVLDIFRNLSSGAGGIFSTMVSSLGSIFGGLGSNLSSVFGTVSSFLKTNVLDVLGDIIGGAANAVSALARVVTGGSSGSSGGGWIDTAISIGSAIFSFFSDERMKENVKFNTTLANGINLYDFNYKSKYNLGTDTKTGVLAQQVQGKYPQAVSVGSTNGLLQVDYSKLPIPQDLLKLAKGGILDGPTMLGTNVMAGEAGPEAVLPLNRGSNGELGVNANGMGTINVNFNITAVDAQGIDQLLIERKQFITNMIRSSVADRGKVLY